DSEYEQETIGSVLSCYQSILEELILTVSSATEDYLSPVDLTYQGLSIAQVEELNREGNLEDVYPLSPLQEGLYYHWLSSSDSSVYFEQMSYEVRGKLDIGLLEQSYELLISRHAVLRTFFTQDLGESLLQVVLKEVPSSFSYEQILDRSFSLTDYRVSDRNAGFDLHKGSQMRLSVLELGEDHYAFTWSHYHILMDGWCVGILIKEFFQFYDSLLAGRAAVLTQHYPYSDYIKWLNKVDKKASLAYWGEYLSGYTTKSSLPKERLGLGPRGSIRRNEFDLEESLRASLGELCGQLGITEYTLIQTVWGILLSRYTDNNDVVFGSVVSGRPGELQGVEEIVGLFINTVPVRIRTGDWMTVRDLLKEVQKNFISGSDHHYTQLADIQSAGSFNGELFDHILVYENYPVQQQIAKDLNNKQQSLELSLESSEVIGQTNYDFAIMIIPGDRLSFHLSYNEGVYGQAQIDRLQQHLIHLIEQVVLGPDMRLSDLEYLSGAERNQLLNEFNATEVGYAHDQTIVDLFEAQVALTPEAVALVFEEHELTYGELNRRSNQLGAYLRTTGGIRPDELVGVKLHRSELLVIALLGILKSGGAYVPIDPEYPQERISYMEKDSGIRVLLDEHELSRLEPLLSDYSEDNLVKVNGSSDLAYVIYTSGTTGTPKGVMIEHGGIANTINSQREIFEIKENERGLLFASLSFDASVSEIFTIITSGGILHIINEEKRKDPVLLTNYIKEQKIDIATIPPAYLKLMQIDEISTMKKLVTAGEEANEDAATAFTNYGIYYNGYGPTETSICATVFKKEKSASFGNKGVPIGTPIANTQIYVLDNSLRLVSIGVAGEICISGRGLARGYLNRPELTEEKFIINPYNPTERLYRTGDLGRWLQDGNLEFIGRRDEQVKIRGYRIELREIESVILKNSDVSAVAVLAKEDEAGDRILIAYIAGKKSLDISVLKSNLMKVLPGFMIPSNFFIMAQLPLSVNGKVNKKELASLKELRHNVEDYTPSRNEIDEQMVTLWKGLLGKDQVGIDDNFFEIGGNSIKVIRLSKLINNLLGVEINIALLFQYSTIKSLSDFLTSQTVDEYRENVDRDELLENLNKFN
ncbi:amino acid adenylation domain-containing protein, partial [Pedobacter psychrotolerans]